MTTPFFSVIIPAFNRGTLLLRAIRSVLAQSFGTYELIVVDDGSTHDLALQEQTVLENGGTFLRQQHAGVASARNHGLNYAQGHWIALLDSDDVWHPDKLERDYAFIRETQGIEIFQCPEIWYRNGKRVNPREIHQMRGGDIFEQSLDICLISSSSSVIRRELLLEEGGWDARFLVCEDYELWLRITAHHHVGLLSTANVTKYGGHEDQLSRAFGAMDRFRVAAILKLLLTTELSLRQRELTLAALRKKATILKKGAAKRQKKEHEVLYTSLISWAEITTTDKRHHSDGEALLRILFSTISLDVTEEMPSFLGPVCAPAA